MGFLSSFIHPLIYSSKKYLLRASFVSNAVVDTEDIVVNKIRHIFIELTSCWRGRH